MQTTSDTNFNPRSHEGSDERWGMIGMTSTYFNPRSHEGSDVIILLCGKKARLFQSTLPRRERRRHPLSTWKMSNFNPRSHEGSDNKSIANLATGLISIHAPTKGATSQGSADLPSEALFQSTLPRRERPNVSDTSTKSSAISIHAPTKGATIIFLKPSLTSYISIHAPTKGATESGKNGLSVARGFQSTLPRRERPVGDTRVTVTPTFQSTLPRRERLTYSNTSINPTLFQSTLPRRERLTWIRGRMLSRAFQSTLPRRERQQF